MKYTPENITQLADNQVFVFGSNEAGRHGLGAAKIAWEKFGAKYGVGEGLTGKCYALPTKDKYLNVLSLEQIEIRIKRFLNMARKHPELEFLVTLIGCGLSGYKPEQIMPFFDCQDIPSNVILPYEFYDHN